MLFYGIGDFVTDLAKELFQVRIGHHSGVYYLATMRLLLGFENVKHQAHTFSGLPGVSLCRLERFGLFKNLCGSAPRAPSYRDSSPRTRW
jgi:hypothetical protein